MIKSICVISPGFPSEEKPYEFTFVDQLVCAMADKGIKICVITPHDMLKTKKLSTQIWYRKTPGGKIIEVFSPSVLTLTTRKIGIINMSILSEWLYKKAIKKMIVNHQIKPDILYGHFLFKSGTSSASIGKELGIPSVCAFGESNLWSIREIGIKKARKKLEPIDGVIAVSTNNKKILVENNLVDEKKITVIPNAVDKSAFYPGDKTSARQKLNLPEDAFIGVFNGSYSFQKGSLRVDEASIGIDGLSMAYLGGGKDEPHGANIIFKGRVPHKDVPDWLRAADFFILPTVEEGCCNAIVEAMSTGLPIITSDKPFNYDILDYKSAILIDPMNIKEIHNAIKKIMKSDQLRTSLGNESLKKSENLDINLRADKIITFLNTLCMKKIF